MTHGVTHGTGTRGRTERLCTRSCPGTASAAALGGNTADLGAPLLSRWGNRGTAAPIGTGTAGREQRRGIAGKGALRDAFLAQQSGSMFPMNRKPAGRQNSSPRRPLPGTQIRVCGPHSPAQPRTAQPQRCRLRDPPFLAQPPFPAVPLFPRAELRKSAGKTPEGSGWIALGGKGKGLPPPLSPPPAPPRPRCRPAPPGSDLQPPGPERPRVGLQPGARPGPEVRAAGEAGGGRSARAAGRDRRSGPAEGPRRSCRDRGGVGRPRASRAGGTRSGAGEGAAFRRAGPGPAALHGNGESWGSEAGGAARLPGAVGTRRCGVLRGTPR